jgi:outer membrane protein OmpA-like peptidoglycan-associated protein
VYVEGYGGVNTLTLKYDYNLAGQFGIGYNDRKIKIGAEIGISNGMPYIENQDGKGNGITFGDYTEGGNYNSEGSVKRISVAPSGNIYSTSTIKKKVVTANQLTFGANFEWFIIKTFTDKVDWFDVGLFSGIGLGYYHSDYNVKYLQPYAKAGLSLNFNVNNVSFLIKSDVRYFSALNGKDKNTDIYHCYLQQCVGVGVRYTIPIKSNKCDKSTVNVIVNNNCQERVDTIKDIIRDTIIDSKIKMLPASIFFLNDSYFIRKTEYRKLNETIQFIKENASHVKLIGMASKVGDSKHNQELSLNRCNAVKDYLINGGLNPDSIDIEPLGDTKSERYEEATDRCVVIVFE